MTDPVEDLDQALAAARHRESATREILEVISGSRDDDQPVFDAILRNAAKLCGSPMARLELAGDNRTTFHCAATWGEEMRSFQVGEVMPLDHPNDLPTAIREGEIRHIHDLSKTELYLARDPVRVRMVEEEGYRTYLVVPLVSGGVGIGAIVLSRREVAPFADADIALVQSFAAQAVIAIENVRQFRELQTRLEREAASREILGVISRSRDEESPVFDVILENAARLCDAPLAYLRLSDQGRTRLDLVAHHGTSEEYLAADRDTPLLLDTSQSDTARAVIEKRVVHVEDLAEGDLYRDRQPNRVHAVETEGMRTLLIVPLLSGDACLGSISLYRREVAPFADDQIALVETFAAQAVIAIENVRQFRELQTRLEREAATREVLEVISQSRDDEMPVFNAILENASRLCNAPLAYLSVANDARTQVTVPAHLGARPQFAKDLAQLSVPMDSQLALVRSITEQSVIRMDDIADDDLYRQREPNRVAMVENEGARSILVVPLLSGGRGIGSFTLYRREVAPFSDDDVALGESFAAQAVIAIENVRQFRELQSRLEREAATRKVLEVIGRSRDDEQPVFDAILSNACRLCETPVGAIVLGREGGEPQTMVADIGLTDAVRELYRSGQFTMDPENSIAARAIVECRSIHVEDMAETEGYRSGDPRFRTLIERQGLRTIMFVPLISEGKGIGCLFMFKHEVKPFTGDQVSLIETFAAQAVIAIENVRQFKALEARTAEVQELNQGLEARVADQVGEIERMGRLKRFMPAAVADAVVLAGDDRLLSSHRALIAVLFCDIRGFTAFCETAEPEETIEVLQTYHEEMGKLIEAHGAGVDHRMGDGIMVLFNDPLPCDDPAGDALRLALAMRARMAELCRGWKRLGHRLGFGVGISLGYATVGMVGSEGRYEYTASGTAVNLAARLSDEAEDGDILLSPRAYAAVEDDIEAESAGELSLKGIQAPVEVFRVRIDDR